MADKYLANALIKINSTVYNPGDDITSVLPDTRTLHSWLAANKITKVRTTVTQRSANKQKIPTGSDRAQKPVKSTPRTQPTGVFTRGTDI